MRKRWIFISLIFAVLIMSSVIAQEIVPTELQPSSSIPPSPKCYFNFDIGNLDIGFILAFILIPLVVLLFHIFLMWKGWKKSTKLFKIVTSIVLIIIAPISLLHFSAICKPVMFYVPWPLALFAAVFIGWLIRYVVIKTRAIR